MSFAFTADDMSNLSPDQKAAIVGACMATVMADGQIDPGETAKFDAEFQKIPWGIERAQVEEMIKLIYMKLQTVRSQAEATQFMQMTADTLPSMDIKEKTIALAAKVAYVNGTMNQNTKNVLNALAAAMHISLPRMAEIATEVKGQAQ